MRKMSLSLRSFRIFNRGLAIFLFQLFCGKRNILIPAGLPEIRITHFYILYTVIVKKRVFRIRQYVNDPFFLPISGEVPDEMLKKKLRDLHLTGQQIYYPSVSGLR